VQLTLSNTVSSEIRSCIRKGPGAHRKLFDEKKPEVENVVLGSL
jgi:hypothetical protein